MASQITNHPSKFQTVNIRQGTNDEEVIIYRISYLLKKYIGSYI
jgi:hypothetical protein